MNQVIKEGDRVVVRLSSYSQVKKPFRATVIGWTKQGSLSVRTDEGKTKTVSADHCKKLADSPQTSNQ